MQTVEQLIADLRKLNPKAMVNYRVDLVVVAPKEETVDTTDAPVEE